ncbi:MAG TPA: transposase [Verrucomicrobiae bacterium]|nr:transposase [Verrucomicrobiae bacterium]
MARKLRVQYPGAIYHLMNRGDRREPIFKDDQDRERFLATLGETCDKTSWQVHAFCLMPNHFHLVVETPQANLVAGMKWFLGTYTSRFNRRHKVFGHLFSGRYKSLVVDGSGDGYLKTACDYVHLNPVRARLLAREEPLHKYRWSSYPLYLQTPTRRPEWLRVDRLLGEWRVAADSAECRRRFAAGVEARRHDGADEGFKRIRRGWCLGGESFRRELMEQIAEQQGAHHYGDELVESAEERARRLIEQALRKKGWTAQELKVRQKGDAFKVRLAEALRAQTTVTVAWIAEHLHMGTRGHLTHLLYWHHR